MLLLRTVVVAGSRYLKAERIAIEGEALFGIAYDDSGMINAEEKPSS